MLQALDTALGSERGLYINVLLRLSPIIPYNVLQYALACTSTSLYAYTVGCLIGALPWSVSMCWLGAVLGDLSAGAIGSATDPSDPLIAALYAVGAVATVVLVWQLDVLTRREIRRIVDSAEGAQTTDSPLGDIALDEPGAE